MRAIALIGTAGAIGLVIWAKRFVGAGYPRAQIGATLAIIVVYELSAIGTMVTSPSATAAWSAKRDGTS